MVAGWLKEIQYIKTNQMIKVNEIKKTQKVGTGHGCTKQVYLGHGGGKLSQKQLKKAQ